MSEEGRSLPVRLGLVLINILMPGLGLQRLGDRRAIYFLLTPPVLLGLILIYYVLTPDLSFGGYAVSSLSMLTIYAVAIIAAMVLSWRGSRIVRAGLPWWTRWYAMVASYVVISAACFGLTSLTHAHYKPFYIPSEAMQPTLLVNDRLIASMRGPGELQRGDIILFSVGNAIYIKRVAALPGDRIAVLDGIVILNGSPVAQRLIATDTVEPSSFGNHARRLSEQFPGESQTHEIYDMGFSIGDDMAERVVLPGHVFVLGDNRDQSADSRFARSEFGVEQLPIGDIRGRALFYTWGTSGRMGEAINH